MKERNQHILNKKLTHLPVYSPKSEIWDHIEKGLDFELKLTDALNDLPKYTPDEKVWGSIKDGLEQTEKTLKTKPGYKVILWSAASIAASIMILLLVKGLLDSNNEKEKISYSQEIVYEENQSIIEQSIENKAVIFIKDQCQRNEIVCMSTNFQDKIKELEKLNKAIDQLSTIEKQYGSSEALVKSQIKLINQRSQLIKELVNYFAS
jgi:hypothetical protein